MSPTFACGMPNPWAPVILAPPSPPGCDHCFCIEQREHDGNGQHLRCCKCGTYMAAKFVEAWFKLLGEQVAGSGLARASGARSADPSCSSSRPADEEQR